MKALAQLKKPDLSREENDVLFAAEQILAKRLRNGEALTDPQVAGRLLQMRLAASDREIFSVVFLDTRHRLIAVKDLFFGTIDGAEVHPRIVVREALTSNAAAVILGHCHPSGNPEPSAADRAVTTRLKAALALVDVRLLDHFVVTAGHPPLSMAARGWV
nr:JAB domain-containing protein [Agrobacterium sp. rho-13.3]MDX8311566.1 JAB domain-containing protein [Agrobacterium sp. rho-13.3]